MGTPNVSPLMDTMGDIIENLKLVAGIFVSMYTSSTPQLPVPYQEFDGHMDNITITLEHIHAAIFKLALSSFLCKGPR